MYNSVIVYCTVCAPPRVKSPSDTIYVTPFYPYLPQSHFLITCWKTFESSRAIVGTDLNRLTCLLGVRFITPCSLSIKQTSRGGSLIWGVSWNRQGEYTGERLKSKWNTLALLWPLQGIWGEIISGLRKVKRKNQWILPAVSRVPAGALGQQPAAQDRAKMSFSGSHKLCWPSGKCLINWHPARNPLTPHPLDWRFPESDQTVISFPT